MLLMDILLCFLCIAIRQGRNLCRVISTCLLIREPGMSRQYKGIKAKGMSYEWWICEKRLLVQACKT